MPLVWAWPLQDARVTAASVAVQQGPTPVPSSLKDLGQIKIIHGKPHASVESARIVWLDAEVQYGETTVSADRFELYRDGTDKIKPGTAYATGHVHLVDPIGLLSADAVTFNWIDRSGEASNAVLTIDGVQLEVFHAVVHPEQWRLDGVRGQLAVKHPLAYGVADHVLVIPGKGARVYGIDGYLFGKRIVGFHSLRFEQTKHYGGDKYPVPTLSGVRGPGVRYRPMYLIDQQTAATASFVSSQTQLPTYSGAIARSFLPKGESQGLILPRYDLDFRFDFGYFETLGVPSPTDEFNLVSTPRDNVSVDSQWNAQAFDRKGTEVFDKNLEATFERSSYLGSGFALLSDTTVQQIRSLGGSIHTRALDYSTLEIPMVRLAPKITLRTRIDAATYQSTDSNFSWVHSQLGLVFRPNQNVRLGAAYIAGKQFGQSLYLADQLYSVNGFDLRGDFSFGPRSISLLAKYDTDRGAWYDREFLLTQAVGPFQAFLRYRTFPSQFILGAQLRVDSVFDQILKRSANRPAPPPREAD